MADSITLKAGVKISAAYIKDLELGDDPAYNLVVNQVENFTTGTAANQAQVLFTDQRTLAANATENLDLAGGLVDAFGRTITFTAIKGIYIKAADENINDVLVGGAASAPFLAVFGSATDKLAIKPGGTVLIMDPGAAGYAVGAGTADLLKVANSAGTTGVTYDIVIWGEGTVA